ncbi:antihemorrhagic factor cHLP-B-like [Dunckerocampus dactyliophorus]|uniref:antihemorrhagic factor cHLP-B-like n=1 Tax=Dunckerocampus dactyliophorus TaxID=161453 RepID=UPI002406D3C8|nr:antihemorrhagic factor cHLP-B-like [Dunckerocampus dactyliophorus]
MWAHLLVALLACALITGDAAPPLDLVTCNDATVGAAVNLAIRHINEHHHHGYKFKLGEIQGHKYEKVGEGCNIDLQLMLFETKCHFTNPKAAEDCEMWEMGERGASASCTSMLSVQDGIATVTRHQCTTQQAMSNEDMFLTCPDCPSMMSLNDPDVMRVVAEAVQKYNQESNHQHYFALLEVGRALSAYIPSLGMVTYPKFALVETNCPKGSRIAPEACVPRCPDRAQYAMCGTSYSTINGVKSPECELYPAKNSAPLGPGEVEPVCASSFHQSAEATTCRTQMTNNDPALHHICPFPLAVQLPQQEQVHH